MENPNGNVEGEEAEAKLIEQRDQLLAERRPLKTRLPDWRWLWPSSVMKPDPAGGSETSPRGSM
jgi:hypothetical protein